MNSTMKEAYKVRLEHAEHPWFREDARSLSDLLRNPTVAKVLGELMRIQIGYDRNLSRADISTPEGQLKFSQNQGISLGLLEFIERFLDLANEDEYELSADT